MTTELEDRVLVWQLEATRSTAASAWRTARLSARVLVLTAILVAISMGLAYLALLTFVANPDAVSFAWGGIHSIDSGTLQQYYRDRNLFLAIGAAAGLVVSFGVSMTLAIQSAAGKSGSDSPQ